MEISILKQGPTPKDMKDLKERLLSQEEKHAEAVKELKREHLSHLQGLETELKSDLTESVSIHQKAIYKLKQEIETKKEECEILRW